MHFFPQPGTEPVIRNKTFIHSLFQDIAWMDIGQMLLYLTEITRGEII